MIPYLGCPGAQTMLEAFIDGELPVSEQVSLEAHLRWCDTCRARIEDMRLIGSALRTRSAPPAVAGADAAALEAMYDEVLARVSAERDQSLVSRWRGLFIDTRYLWPALGASAAVALCLYASTLVSGTLRAVRPDSMAALIEILASPGSDENPLYLKAGMLVPRTLEMGPAFASIPDEEAVFAVSAVVTREGRVSNYALLRPARGRLADGSPATPADEVDAVLDAVRHSRFEPAQTADGVVAVSMVWVLARTTVRASARPEDADGGAVSAEPAPVLRPARL